MFIIAAVLAVAIELAQAQQVYYLPVTQDSSQNKPQPATIYQQAPAQVQPSYQPVYEQPSVVQQPQQASFPSPVYAYIPPSPIAPPCPNGFTCCGNYKYFDPTRTKKCCGDRAFSPQLQSCANGMVVSIIQANPPPPTTPLPIYVQRVELICQGVKWQVPYPNYECCGPSVYNVARETCSQDLADNHRHHPNRPAQPVSRSTTPEPDSSEEDDHHRTTTMKPVPTRILSCQGRRYLVPAVDYQFYACCGFESYFWLREQCVNGAVSPPRPTTTTTSKTPIPVPVLVVCDTTQHWVASDERPYYGCCGSDLYDMRVETCRAPLKPTDLGTSTTNTGNCLPGYLCCEGLPAVDNTGGNLQCCAGIGPFDPVVSSCPTANK